MKWLVRPPRRQYGLENLDINSPKSYAREDFEVLNCRNEKLQASEYIWRGSTKKIPVCVVYFHPNSSSRIEVCTSRILKLLEPHKMNLVAFDFAGCGLSDGEFITLGVREAYDIPYILAAILERGGGRGIERFLLWGRSMGSVSIIRFLQILNSSGSPELARMVAGLVLDSPFTSFTGLVYNHIVHGTKKKSFPHKICKLMGCCHLLTSCVSSLVRAWLGCLGFSYFDAIGYGRCTHSTFYGTSNL
jgi:pimeloyl-ACP methyl ester carboxylesterase